MHSEMDLGFQINTLSHCIRRRMDGFLAKVQTGGDGITGPQGRILGWIARHPDQDLFQRDLEREFHIRRSTATGLLQLLERDGLIIRRPVPYDARLKKLCLTERGEAVHAAVYSQIMEMENRLRQGLTDEEIHTFLQIIAKIRKNLED